MIEKTKEEEIIVLEQSIRISTENYFEYYMNCNECKYKCKKKRKNEIPSY